MAERYDDIFEDKEGDKVKTDESDTGQNPTTPPPTTTTTNSNQFAKVDDVALESNDLTGAKIDPNDEKYFIPNANPEYNVDQTTVNKAINGEKLEYLSEEELKQTNETLLTRKNDNTNPNLVAKERKTDQVTNLNELDCAELEKKGWFKVGESAYVTSDITGEKATYEISHNSDGSYEFKDVNTNKKYTVRKDTNGNYTAYDGEKALDGGKSVSFNLQRVSKIKDLCTPGNGIDMTANAKYRGIADLGSGDDEWWITVNEEGVLTFDSVNDNGTYTVKYNESNGIYEVTDTKNQKTLNWSGIDDLSLINEQFLWKDTKTGVDSATGKVLLGGATDIARVGGSVFGDDVQNFYYTQNKEKLTSSDGAFNNEGAKEELTTYTYDPEEHRTVANIHDYGNSDEPFTSAEEAAVALSRNGTFSYTEAKRIVNKAIEGGTTNTDGNIVTADFTIAPIGNKVEYYIKNSFVTEYDTKWKDYIALSKSDVEKIESNIRDKVGNIKNEVSKVLNTVNSGIEQWKGKGASAALNALECTKAKIVNLYNNIIYKLEAAIEALRDLDLDIKELDSLEDLRKKYGPRIDELRNLMMECNKSADYTKVPQEYIGSGKYKYYKADKTVVSGYDAYKNLPKEERGGYEEIKIHNELYDDYDTYRKEHDDLMKKMEQLIADYEPLQDKINEEINLVINFGTTIDSFDTFLCNETREGGMLSSADSIVANHESILRELTTFKKYPVITDKDTDYPEGTIVYMDDDPNARWIVTGHGWDENGRYVYIEKLDPITGKPIGDGKRIYDVREISKPVGWNNPVYKTTAPQDIPAGTTAPPKGPVGPAGTTAPPKGPVGPSGTTAPPGTVAPVGTTAPPIIPTTKPSTIPPTTRPTVVPTVRPTVIPTVIPTIPSVIPDIDDPVGPAIPTLPPIPTPPTTPGPFIPHTGLENFASSKETNESSLGLAGLAGLGLGALGLGAAAMSSDKEEDEEESKEEKEDKKQENVNKDFPNAWNHTVENNSEHIQ